MTERKLLVLLALILAVSSETFGQTTIEKKDTVDTYPSFPGGLVKLYEYIKQNLNYPEDAKKWELEGTVFVEFVVDSTGAIKPESIGIVKGICMSCDKEAIRLVKESPMWIPGWSLALNRNISARVVLPIKFILER